MISAKDLAATLKSRLAISAFKSVLAYSLAFILIFLQGFTSTVPFPIALTSTILVAIAGKPGGNIGETINGAIYGGLGVASGAFFFYVLASIPSRVGQGFVFLLILYFYAYIKAISMKYFAFSLLGIIVSFTGIYTSILTGGFSAAYLQSYLIAFAYGFALVLVVNLGIFPISAERQFRIFLVQSLERISTLAHLVSKTYTLEINDEERVVRDTLHQSIRADFGFLQSSLADVSLELNWTRWSMQDYAAITGKIQRMQFGLINSYSSLLALEKFEPEALAILKQQLIGTGEDFLRLRRGADLIVKDIVSELVIGAGTEHTYHSPAPGSRSWVDFIEKPDVESAGRPRAASTISSYQTDEVRMRLDRVATQLSAECAGVLSKEKTKDSDRTATATASPHPERDENHASRLDRIAFLRNAWTRFEAEQTRAITLLLSNSLEGDDVLLLDITSKPSIALPVPIPAEGSSQAERAGDAVKRVTSFVAGMGAVVESLAEMHELVIPVIPRTKSFHLHFFEKLSDAANSSPAMSLKEALALLDNRIYIKPKVPFFVRLVQFEKMLRSERSLYALKTAVAVSVLAVFLLAPSLQGFFVQYSLTGGLITLVVALAPSLGQTIFTFALQIGGVGIGSIYGMVVLFIFRDVGGFSFNPYGMVVLITLFAMPFCWILYAKPMFFAFCLLAMNAVGTIVVTQWVYNEVPGQFLPGFDGPSLRAGKALVSMSLALVIAAFFQLFVLRTPARHTLRIQLSEVTEKLSAHNILFQAMVNAVIPYNNDEKVNATEERKSATRRIYQELVKREIKIQGDILALYPLVKFSQVEFDFGRPFDAATYSRLIKSHQLILDRLREARSSFENPGEGFSDAINAKFTSVLSPYRQQGRRFSRALFYLCATSLATKHPLPHELPSMAVISRGVTHDALVLSHRLTRDEEGRKVLNGRGFLRYWFFLSSYADVGRLLQSMEQDLRILFEPDEDSQF